jgi:protein-S-isoprenylcysteine O-methyltransferase Ste14
MAMSADRALDLLSLLVLACVAGAGGVRIAALRARGVWVFPLDRERSAAEALIDLAAVLGMAAWICGVVATALARAGHRAFGPLGELEVPWPPLRWLGLAGAAAGVALYAVALHDLGLSWRFTIDRERPGELVTTGVFARSRNPIYLSLVLVALGVSLAVGRTLLIGVACGAPLYFHFLIQREERFLAAHYGEAYASYCARAPRWWRWRRRRASPGFES